MTQNFLDRLINKFGKDVTFLSVRDIGKGLNMNRETVRQNLLALQKDGYIKLKKVNARKQLIIINDNNYGN